MFVAIVLRQRDLLKLASRHAQILVHRPFLENCPILASHGNRHRQHAAQALTRSAEAGDNVGLCLNAASSIARLIHDINVAESCTVPFW